MMERCKWGSFGGCAWCAVVILVAAAGCKTTQYRLLVLDELHDDRYDLRYQIEAPTAMERAWQSLGRLVGNRPSTPSIRRVDDPGTLCQDTILGLASHPPGDPGEYASTIAVLAPISALGENPLSRSHALVVMVFLHRKLRVPVAPPEGGLAPFEVAEEAIGRLSTLLARHRENPRDAEVIAECRTEFDRIGGVEFARIPEAASALELFGRYWSDPAFRDVIETGIHRLAPRTITRCLTSALRDSADFVRVDAIDGLAAIEAPSAATLIAARLRVDPSRDVRRTGARALGRLSTLEAVPDLISALEKEEDPGVRWVAMTSLERIAGEKLGLYPEPWQQWWDRKKEQERAGRAAGRTDS